MLIVFLTLFGSGSCVSRYEPLPEIKPLSGTCRDYVLFSTSLVKQRDHGLSKRAAISIAGFALGSEQKKHIMYERYKPVIETIYADFLLPQKAVEVFAKVQCEHQLDKNWRLLINEQYAEAARTIRFCRQDNFLDSLMEKCLLQAAGQTRSGQTKGPGAGLRSKV